MPYWGKQEEVAPMYAINPSSPLLHTAAQATPWLSASATRIATIYFEDFISLGFTLVLAGALFGGPWIRVALSITPLRILGILSYSIYLFHLPILHNVVQVFSGIHSTPDIKFALYLGGTLAETIVVATVVYLFIEKPFIILARRRGGASLPLPAEAPALRGRFAT